jgi:acyl-CoA thioester hydrolase
MTDHFSRRFRVRHYELDLFGHVNDVVLIRYMQEAAIEASTALGFSPDWYREHGVGWVVRRLSVRYLSSVAYGDEVHINTWISGVRGVRSTREYDLIRSRDGIRLARGRAEWVFMEAASGQPIRVPDEWAAVYATKDKLEDMGVRLNNPQPTQGAHRYTSHRRVQFHELDVAQHVNHAVYLQWAGQAHFDALRAAGHPPERALQEGWRVFQAGHEVQYFAPALDNENIEIASWVCEVGETGAAWTHEISNADTHKLLARDYSPVIFLNAERQPATPPQSIIEDVLRGPRV